MHQPLDALTKDPDVKVDDLGEPNLRIEGFRLWVHGRESSESDDYWDGNWLRVTANCVESGASVWTQGSLLRTTDVSGFGDECAAMYRGDGETARLDPLEPEINVVLEATDSAGHIVARVEITPDHLSQQHRFDFTIDQSYLPEIITQCSGIVRAYPIRGHEDGEGV